MKITILVVYFGNLPDCSQLFLASCCRNKQIEFLLIGDAWRTEQDCIPENCRIVDMDLKSFRQLTEVATGVKIERVSPYKICDYRPAFGVIFKNELTECDYWGSCDVDIILGDMSAFLENLDAYDVFSTREEYLSGPLSLMRNCEVVNSMYESSKDYVEIFSSNEHSCFDECAFAWDGLHAGRSILDLSTKTESMTEVIVKSVARDEIKAHFETLSLDAEKQFKGVVEVSGRKVKMDRENYIHYHHLHNKGSAVYTFPNWHWTQVPESYRVTKFGVFSDFRSFQLLYRMKQFYNRWNQRMKKKISRKTLDPNISKIT